MSARIPTDDSAGNRGRVGTGREQGSFSDNRWVKWCRENLPDEHAGYAYIATQHLLLRLPKDERKPPTVEAVRAELRRMGKDRESLG